MVLEKVPSVKNGQRADQLGLSRELIVTLLLMETIVNNRAETDSYLSLSIKGASRSLDFYCARRRASYSCSSRFAFTSSFPAIHVSFQRTLY